MSIGGSDDDEFDDFEENLPRAVVSSCGGVFSGMHKKKAILNMPIL